MSCREVKNIICDKCGYYDSAKKFPDIYTLEGQRILKKFGLDPEDINCIQPTYAGAICPKCGNSSEFDFNPPSDINQQAGAYSWLGNARTNRLKQMIEKFNELDRIQ